MNKSKVLDLKEITEGTEVPYKQKLKNYKKDLDQIKEFYNPKEYRKFNKYRDWKTEWKGYVEYTYPWDGGNIFEMIVYRLEVLATNFKYFSHHVGTEKEIEEIMGAVALGKKIMNEDNYFDPSHKFSDKHCAHIINVYNKDNHLIKTIKRFKDTDKTEESIDDMHESFFGDKEIKNWCKENHINFKDIHTSYSGEWDSEDNAQIWRDMLKKAQADRKKDIKSFYAILAKKLESWWD